MGYLKSRCLSNIWVELAEYFLYSSFFRLALCYDESEINSYWGCPSERAEREAAAS